MLRGCCVLLAVLAMSPALRADNAFGGCFPVTNPQLFDLTGSYNIGLVEGNGNQGSLSEMQLTLAHDAKGRIAGTGTAILELRKSAERPQLTFAVTGTAVSLAKRPGVVSVLLKFSRFKCSEPPWRSSGSLVATLELIDAGVGLIGTIKGTIAVADIKDKLTIVAPLSMPLPEANNPENGDWMITASGYSVGNKASGTATITVANRRTFDFTMAGTWSEARQALLLTLKGTGAAKGTSFTGTVTNAGDPDLPYLSLRGKLLGQTIVIVALAPRINLSAELSDIVRVSDADITECESAAHYLAAIGLEAVSPSRALLGGSLKITGPDETETLLLEEELCAESDFEACSLDARELAFQHDYSLEGPYSSWKVTYTLTDAEGFVASLTLPIDNPDVATPKSGLIIAVRQTAPLVLEGDDEVGIPFCLTVVDENYALLGGSLTVQGPSEKTTLSIDESFCGAINFDSCDVDAGMLRFSDTYYVHGPQAAWPLKFTVRNALGTKAIATLKVLNPRQKLTVSIAQIGKAQPVPGEEPDLSFAFSLEVRDPDAALTGGMMLVRIGRDYLDFPIDGNLCTAVEGLQCVRDDGLFWLVKDDAITSARNVPLQITVINALGKRGVATIVVR